MCIAPWEKKAPARTDNFTASSGFGDFTASADSTLSGGGYESYFGWSAESPSLAGSAS
jgi:hypothetical protein